MPGERSYSTAAIQALRDHYYSRTPRTRVDDILDAAKRRRLHTWQPELKLHPTVEAEIAQISRTHAYELLRTDPRRNDQDRNHDTLNTYRQRLDQILTEGIKGESRAREAERLRRLLQDANKPSARTEAAKGPGAQLLATLTDLDPTDPDVPDRSS